MCGPSTASHTVWPAAGTAASGLRRARTGVAALPAEVLQVQDVGTYWLLSARRGELTLRVRLDPEVSAPIPGAQVWLKVTGAHTCYYGRNDELITRGAHSAAATEAKI